MNMAPVVGCQCCLPLFFHFFSTQVLGPSAGSDESYESDDRALQKAIELSFAEKKKAKEDDNDLLEQAIALSLAELSDNECDPKSN